MNETADKIRQIIGSPSAATAAPEEEDMRLLVVGATGGLGRAVVAAALSRGPAPYPARTLG